MRQPMTLRSLSNAIVRPFLIPPLMVVYAFDWVITRLERFIGAKRMPYFFLLPNMAIFAVFILLPMMLNFAYSFTSGDSINLAKRPWAGTDNFDLIFSCQDITLVNTCKEDLFWRAVRNSIVFVIFEVPLMVVSALAIALALNREIVMRGFFRGIFFYPVLLSPVVVGIIWKWVLQDRSGLINTVLLQLGVPQVEFLVNTNWALTWTVFVSIWAQVGFYTLILLAGLQSIPPSLYEAARIDGANERAQFWRVTLPLLQPTMLVVLVLALIRGVQAFDIIYVLTGGGPGTSTMLMVQYIFRTGLGQDNYGLAAAASLLLALALAGLTLLQLVLNRNQTEAV